MTFVASRGQLHFVLCTLYRAQFSTSLLQVLTKYSLAHAPDLSLFCHRLVTLVATGGQLCAPDVVVVAQGYTIDQRTIEHY